ncbi:tyrosine-protein phosphatase [Paenibacillus segetis]|uniref:Tyrosine-protein phosphatase n=1 Tax=Paenibacillus segetis TaxID=1325360 RepID=A0ABQ1Y7C0_9BACL|nr:CpsB/CapC family capsule biosynthesis tyrosine phosphatase [Paenibacillus segetis]GGH15337.1 tyrosine protein phosphatase [Paenibacillus segetis]
MIDIHTHILPGVDDGAENWNDTLDMARAAVSEGITTIIATPHHANGRYINSAVEVVEHTRYINEQLFAEGVPVTILPGQEIRVHMDLLEAWSRAELLPLASSNYVLIEMPSSHIPKEMEELIHELHIMKLKPIIAHPERNAEVMKNPQRLAELLERGAFAQVTSHSLLGGFGRRVEKLAWTLCRNGLIHIVSSDAHHVERRGFRLREAYDVIGERMGEQWYNYFINNAQCVLEDKNFNSLPTINIPKGMLRRMLTYFHHV